MLSIHKVVKIFLEKPTLYDITEGVILIRYFLSIHTYD